MNMNTKAISLLLAVGALASAAAARDFEYQGIWYTVLDEGAKTCETRAGEHRTMETHGEDQWVAGNNLPDNAYNPETGDVIIPAIARDEHNTAYTVTAIGDHSFYRCRITVIVLPGSIKTIGDYAFADCELFGTAYVDGAPALAIPNSVTAIGDYAFAMTGVSSYGNGNLREIIIPGSVERIGERAFQGQFNALNSFIVEDSNRYYSSKDFVLFNKDQTELICAIGEKLTKFDIPNSVTTLGSYAFSGNFLLEEITIPNSVTSIGSYAFNGCFYLKEVAIPNSVNAIGNYAFCGCSTLTNVTLHDGITEVKDGVFSRCHLLKSVKLGNSVKSIGTEAFFDCYCLTDINIPETVAEIGESAFERCHGLNRVDLGESLTEIGDKAFMYCYGLENINIPNSVTKIGASAFNECSHLTNITIPEALTTINANAFAGCRGLTSIVIPNSVTEIGQAAFFACSGLTSIKIPNSITYIRRSTFGDCENLAEVEIPNSVTGIGQFAFSDCKSLTSIVIPESVKVIEDSAFDIDHGESALTDITLPSTLAELGEYVFSGQDNVRNVYYGAAEPIRGYFNTFSEKCYKDAKLHVSAEAVDKIKSTVPWSLFANIEQSGIDEVETEAAAEDGEVYTLQGVRAAKPLRPGVYVGNGRKMIVK